MFMKVFAILAVLVILTASSAVYGDENQKAELYKQLFEEAKKDGLPMLNDTTPENIGELTSTLIKFVNSEDEVKFSLLQNKISFIERTGLYPSLENLINAAFSDGDGTIYAMMTMKQISDLEGNELSRDRARKYRDDYNIKVRAFHILTSKYMQLEEDKPSVEQVKKYLEKCENIGIIVSGIPLLIKLDKKEGFRFADDIMRNENVPSEERQNLSREMKRFTRPK